MYNKSYNNSFGFILSNLGFSQSYAMLAQEINKIHNNVNPNMYDFCVFSESPQDDRIINNNFAISDLFWSYTFRGHLIATNLNTAEKILHMPCLSKTFYVWDLEWLRLQRFQYEHLSEIYGNKKLKLVARSQEHADLIEDSWNCKVYSVIEDFKLDGFIELLSKNTKTNTSLVYT
jgi:hypothetical protein